MISRYLSPTIHQLLMKLKNTWNKNTEDHRIVLVMDRSGAMDSVECTCNKVFWERKPVVEYAEDVTQAPLWSNQQDNMERKSYELLVKIIDFIKKEKDHEGTSSVATPSEILDRIYGLSEDFPELKERILG